MLKTTIIWNLIIIVVMVFTVTPHAQPASTSGLSELEKCYLRYRQLQLDRMLKDLAPERGKSTATEIALSLAIADVYRGGDFHKSDKLYPDAFPIESICGNEARKSKPSDYPRLIFWPNTESFIQLQKATPYYLRASALGSSEAKLQLGTMYKDGRGVPKSLKTAEMFFSEAARSGHVQSQFNLGLLYSYPADKSNFLLNYKLAYMWTNIAASSGNQSYVDMLQQLTEAMKPEDVESAQQMSIHCFNSNFRACSE